MELIASFHFGKVRLGSLLIQVATWSVQYKQRLTLFLWAWSVTVTWSWPQSCFLSASGWDRFWYVFVQTQ